MEGKLSKKEKNELVGGREEEGERESSSFNCGESKRGGRGCCPLPSFPETESLFSALPSELLSVLTHGGEEGGEKECVVCCVTEEGEKRKKEGGRKWRSDGFDEERMEGRGWNGRSLLPFPTMIRASNGGSFFPFSSFYFPGGFVS